MKNFTHKKLIKDLESFEDIDIAEEHVRAFPISIREKLHILETNRKLLTLRKAKTDYSPKYEIKKRFHRLNKFAKKIKGLFLTPFQNRINSIEKNLGHDVASYFIYTKWLFYHNFISYMVLILPFISIPHFIILKGKANILSGENNLTNFMTSCLHNQSELKLKPIDFFVAGNFLELGFFGCFSSHSFIIEEFKFKYRMEYAYLLTIIVYFLYWLYKSGSRLSGSITETFMKSRMLLKRSIFSTKIFVSWPYLLANNQSVIKRSSQIKLDLLENLAILKFSGTKKTMETEKIFFIIFTNFLFTLIAASYGVGLYFLFFTNVWSDITHKNDLKIVIVAIFINFVNYVAPIVCNVFSFIEKLHKSTENFIKMIRMFIIQLISLGLTFGFLLEDNNKDCWETMIGQQIYAIIIIDYFLFLVDLLVVSFYKIITSKLNTFEIQFNSAYYTLNAMFSQALIWIGIYFSPFIVLLQIIKLIIIFFVKAYQVKRLYKMPKTNDFTTRNYTYLLSLTLMLNLSISFGMGYINSNLPVSSTCGPFTDSNLKTPLDYIFKLKEEISKEVWILGLLINLFLQPGLIAFLLFLLSVFFYSSYTIFCGYKKTVKLLKIQLDDKKSQREVLLNRTRKNHIDKRRLTLENCALRNRKSESYKAFLTECYPNLENLENSSLNNTNDQLNWCYLNSSIDSTLDNDERKSKNDILEIDQFSIKTASKISLMKSKLSKKTNLNEISDYSDEKTFLGCNKSKNDIELKEINPTNFSKSSNNQKVKKNQMISIEMNKEQIEQSIILDFKELAIKKYFETDHEISDYSDEECENNIKKKKIILQKKISNGSETYSEEARDFKNHNNYELSKNQPRINSNEDYNTCSDESIYIVNKKQMKIENYDINNVQVNDNDETLIDVRSDKVYGRNINSFTSLDDRTNDFNIHINYESYKDQIRIDPIVDYETNSDCE